MLIPDPLLHRLHDSALGSYMRESPTAFPWVESIHVLAVVLVVGSIAIVDLRLLGYRSHRRGTRRLIIDMLPFTWVAFAVAVVAGALLFASNALVYAHNAVFQAKMIVIVAAGINMLVFHLTAYRRIVDWDEAMPTPLAARVAGATSLLLWLGVIFLGRWIGFTLY